MEDYQLLNEFAANRSETAFQTLTNRHLNLVYSVALRRVGDAQLAQDVSQAVFLLLARKAGRLPADTVLPGWLYRTTQFVAQRALRSQLRRQRRETEAFQMQSTVSSDPNWQQLAPVLDEALEKLKAADRDAIILRYFQAHSLLQVGLALGVSEGAAGKRVARALETLRAHFGRRGFTITLAAIAASLSQQGAGAAPVNLGPTIVKSVFLKLPSTATVHYALVQETLRAWQWAQWRWLATWSACAVAAGLLLFSVTHTPTGAAPVSPVQRASLPPLAAASQPDPAVPPTSSPTALAPTNFFTLWAVDGVTGKGIAGAKVMATVAQDPRHIERLTNLMTDTKGCCAVPLPYSNWAMLALGVLADGYEERCVVGGGPQPLPDQYVLKLPRGSTIGGVVQDESGHPVAGAGILVAFSGTGDHSEREFQRERPGFPEDYAVATTDAGGRWRFASAPATNDDFNLQIKHPDFPTAAYYPESDGRDYAGSVGRFKLAEMHAGSAVFVLAGGIELNGTVTDDHQAPVPGARISFGQYDDPANPSAHSVSDGTFRLKPLSAGKGVITVVAKGYAPERLPVEVLPISTPLAIELKPAAQLRLRVVDDAGTPVDHVDVRLQAWHGYNTLDWGGFTDPDGKISWDSAPRDEMNLYAGKEGYFASRNNMIIADGEEHTIKLHPQISLSGWVTDADTGLPIASFKVIPGRERLNLAHGTNGAYMLTFQEISQPLQAHFEAEGYAPDTSEPLSLNQDQQICNISLKPQKPSDAVQGTVLLPDGSPAAGAQVALSTAEKTVRLGVGKFLDRHDSILTTADASGHFAFPVDPAPRSVIAIHPQGFSELKLDQPDHRVIVQLQPWGRIEGTLTLRSGKNDHRQINLMSQLSPYAHGTFRVDVSADTDAQGNFVFEQLPPGDFELYLFPGMNLSWTHQTPVKIQPGETLPVQIGGTGSTVTGQFVLSDPSRPINWATQTRNANIATPHQPPPVPPELKGEARQKWIAAYYNSEAGMAISRAARNYPLTVVANGSFTAEDVPAGTYTLNASLSSQPIVAGEFPQPDGPMLAWVHQEIIVPAPADNQSSDPINLGIVTVTVKAK